MPLRIAAGPSSVAATATATATARGAVKARAIATASSGPVIRYSSSSYSPPSASSAWALTSTASRARARAPRSAFSSGAVAASRGIRLKSTSNSTSPRHSSSTSHAEANTEQRAKGSQEQNLQESPSSTPFPASTPRPPVFTPAQPPPSTGPPRLIRHPPPDPRFRPTPHRSSATASSSYYPAPHYYSPPSPLGASALIAKQRAERQKRSRLQALPLFQFRSALAEVDFDSPSSISWTAQQQRSARRGGALPIPSDLERSIELGAATADQRHLQPEQSQSQPQAQSDLSSKEDNTQSLSTSSEQANMPSSLSSKQTAASVSTPAQEQTLRRRKDDSCDEHDHGHSHGIFHSHDHSHSHGSAEDADRLIAALKGKGDRGSNITLLGLFSNIVLCISKGVAGAMLNSASLVADAAHSLSDMFSDLVTLFCWKMSQKPPSRTHPLGYGKYETMGGLGVSVVLVGGAAGIGLHSWSLLVEALGPMIETAPAFIKYLSSWTASLGLQAHSHGHTHGSLISSESGALDPNAMWFALLSVAVKEWLYRSTLRIAREEKSSVLEANALHHRSDSLSSGVTFLAIGGSWLGLPILDPLGGLLVAALIGKQGFELLLNALAELSDRGVEETVLRGFEAVMEEEISLGKTSTQGAYLVGYKDLRAIKSGVSTFIDVTLILPGKCTLEEARAVEDRVRARLVDAYKGVKEVRIHLAPQGMQQPAGVMANGDSEKTK